LRKFYRFSLQSGNPLFARRDWFDGDTANFSIGQGELLVTPMQLARMMAVFANRGILVTPFVTKAIDGRDVSIYQRKNIRISIRESTVEFIRQALRNVVADPTGTANILSGIPFPIAGKTGTAQVMYRQPHGWFAGFFPFKDPKFVICVFLEHGGSGYASCVLAKQIIEEMIKEGEI
jgi:penicillin-binding protein 2